MQQLISALDTLKQPHIAIIGDLILDEYIYGEIRRISREAPVPIVEENKREFKPGGAANALYNLTTLGAKVSAIGIIGNDKSGENLSNLLESQDINVSGLIIDNDLPTATKTRISAQSRQSVSQQVMRLDLLPTSLPTQNTIEALKTQLERLIPEIDLLIISDYENGVVHPEIISKCQSLCKLHKKDWIVDSQGDLRRFKGASLLTPNKPEAEQNLGHLIQTHQELLEAGKELLSQTDSQAVLITRGDEGMSLFQRDIAPLHIPVLNKSEVFDVTGAGDTVVAMIGLAVASGLSLEIATHLSNLAASIVVRRSGASTTTVSEMKHAITNLLT